MIMCAAAAAYQVVAILAALRTRSRAARVSKRAPHVTILKPIRGADPNLYDALRSNAAQDYPSFEILFGVSNPADPAIPIIEHLAADFPSRNIRLFRTTPTTPNAKVGVMQELLRHATGSIILIADADIRVPPGYLQRVTAPLNEESIGLVTCAYRARAETWPARFEALGIATDFSPAQWWRHSSASTSLPLVPRWSSAAVISRASEIWIRSRIILQTTTSSAR
jgi:ceramide glucosyltransferase